VDLLTTTFLAPMGCEFRTRDTKVIVRPGWYQLLTPSVKDGSRNEVMLSRIEPADADRVIDDTVDEYRAHGLTFRWAVTPLCSPRDLSARLGARGFERWPARGMACSPRLELPPAAPGVTVEQIDAARVDLHARVSLEGWAPELPFSEPAVALMREDLLWSLEQREPRFAYFLARDGGEPAATAGVVLKPDVGYLIGANVLPRFRGRGIYRALVGARLALLQEAGLELAATLAREATSAPILERLGFTTVAPFEMFRIRPPVS
jgi:GNAT superfamily N-acetyltransferase